MGAIGEVCIALAGVPACVPSSMSGEGTTSVSMSGIMPAMARGVPSCVVLILVAWLCIQEQSVEINIPIKRQTCASAVRHSRQTQVRRYDEQVRSQVRARARGMGAHLASDKHVRVMSVTLGKHKAEGTVRKYSRGCLVTKRRSPLITSKVVPIST